MIHDRLCELSIVFKWKISFLIKVRDFQCWVLSLATVTFNHTSTQISRLKLYVVIQYIKLPFSNRLDLEFLLYH